MRDKMGFLRIVICCWNIMIILCNQGNAENGSDDSNGFAFDGNWKIRPDTRVVLRVPFEKILEGEWPQMYIAILNKSETPIKLIDMFDSREQMIFQARETPSGLNLTRPEFIPNWPRLQSWRYGYITELQSYTYKIYDCIKDIGLYYDIYPRGTKEIRVGILTGPDEWVFSNWARIQRLYDRNLDDCTLLTSVNYSVELDLPIRKALIDNDTYLYYARTRICRIPDGATPRFDWDKEKSMLTVHFDGVDIPPFVYYARMYDFIEWTAEVAPHQEVLAALKREMEQELQSIRPIEQADDATSAPVPSDSSVLTNTSLSTVTTVAETQISSGALLQSSANPSAARSAWRPWLFWILVAAGILMPICWVFIHLIVDL